MKRKIIGGIVIFAIAALMAFNINMTKGDGADIDISISEVEVLASEGSFPACQKNKGTKPQAEIPFCVNGVCKQTYENRGKLDVNYCVD
jgi:crotonobetainyl-CoA:carnitine CoA-transferase CaiB-like acyl-CoA transferase